MKKETPEIIRRTMVKKVNVIAQIPVRTVYPPIYGTYKGIMMSPANILKCITHKAVVEEVLEDGSTVRLDTSNYNTINVPDKEKSVTLENRKSAIMGPKTEADAKGITMKKIVNHTAPIPNGHFLYNVKDTCDIEEPISQIEAEKLDADRNAELLEETTPPERDLPVTDADSGESETDGKCL